MGGGNPDILSSSGTREGSQRHPFEAQRSGAAKDTAQSPTVATTNFDRQINFRQPARKKKSRHKTGSIAKCGLLFLFSCSSLFLFKFGMHFFDFHPGLLNFGLGLFEFRLHLFHFAFLHFTVKLPFADRI